MPEAKPIITSLRPPTPPAPAPAAPAGHRVAAADTFAEHGQVGLDAEVALGAAQAQPKTGHDLVEDQQGAELVAELAHAGVELERHRPRAALKRSRNVSFSSNG